MREIKFRAWDKGGDSWMPSKLIQDLLGIGVPDDPREGIFEIHDYHTNRYELMQYTGLKDKNGVEIFEGDVVNSHIQDSAMEESGIIKVVFRGGYFGVTADDFEYEPLFLHFSFCEVIGNIYENPELLVPPTTAIGKGE